MRWISLPAMLLIASFSIEQAFADFNRPFLKRFRLRDKQTEVVKDSSPKEKISLFNGKDLTGFYTYLGSPKKGEKHLGKNNDPTKVFSVKDGAIRVSGEIYGCFTTEKEY